MRREPAREGESASRLPTNRDDVSWKVVQNTFGLCEVAENLGRPCYNVSERPKEKKPGARGVAPGFFTLSTNLTDVADLHESVSIPESV